MFADQSRMTRQRDAGWRGKSRQRGSVAVMAAIWVMIAIVVLGAIDVGNLYFQRRNLQRIADMAAIASVESMTDQCSQQNSPAMMAAQSNALANGFDYRASGQTLSIECGRWDTSATPYFNSTFTPLNAVSVSVTQQVPYIFLGRFFGKSGSTGATVAAFSTAKAINIDAFTIGTTLAALQGGMLNNILGTLLGAKLNISALSYKGLASAQIKVGDLVVAANSLKFGSFNSISDLANLSVTAGDFVKLMASALSKTQLVNADLSAAIGDLNTISSLATNGTKLNVLGSESKLGVLLIGLADKQAAADARINVLDAVMVAAEVASASAAAQGQAPVTLNTGIALGVLNATVAVQIINPPTLAVGEGGRLPAAQGGGWRTQASSATVRLFLDVDLGTTNLKATLTNPLAPLIALIGAIIPIDVHIPIYLEAGGTGTAWLESTYCAPTAAASRAVVGVQPGIANLCIGDQSSSPLTSKQPFSCSNPATLVSVPVVGVPLLQVKANVAIPVTVPIDKNSASPLVFDGIAGNSDDYQSSDSNALGSVLTNALSGVPQGLANSSSLALYVLGAPVLPALVGTLLSPVVDLLNATLFSLLPNLDKVIVPLLNALGVQIGVATVHNEALTCGIPQLVSNTGN
ncbi:TadG family pilus assembly protein [Burkholderia multivorans]|uniref:TadG family pilus assembly protein n=1 Tax=Burkholderia multivorans TaxID=87883 RepID=UPI002158AFBF|nr:TadG family pilus assembly protein [Burkholderia multivorans]MDN8007634.1 TadG family pilus assembly protein [Burkholderia multivorans]